MDSRVLLKTYSFWIFNFTILLVTSLSSSTCFEIMMLLLKVLEIFLLCKKFTSDCLYLSIRCSF